MKFVASSPPPPLPTYAQDLGSEWVEHGMVLDSDLGCSCEGGKYFAVDYCTVVKHDY